MYPGSSLVIPGCQKPPGVYRPAGVSQQLMQRHCSYQENDQDLDLDRSVVGLNATPLVAGDIVVVGAAHSSAGGVRFDQVDEGLMLTALPGVFVAGEMLDWEAPTGGYLLQACFASGAAAAKGVLAWLARQA